MISIVSWLLVFAIGTILAMVGMYRAQFDTIFDDYPSTSSIVMMLSGSAILIIFVLTPIPFMIGAY